MWGGDSQSVGVGFQFVLPNLFVVIPSSISGCIIYGYAAGYLLVDKQMANAVADGCFFVQVA